jgi:serine protease Do
MLKRKEFILGAAVGLTIAAGATAGGVINWPSASAQDRPGISGRLAGVSTVAFAQPPGAPRSFADIFDQVSPAVVQIDVTVRGPERRGPATVQIPGFPFAIPMPQQPGGQGGQGGQAPEGSGSGSGFFISADGFIVTNNHVVENATRITVKLTDERELEARVVGRDPDTDLAVLKVEGSDFPFVEFETQAAPRVGDWVIAVGNPFGLGGTATTGIVSARGRDIGEAYVDFIQIDAPINRGNSGGPTFDIYGRVIGVNTAIFSPNGYSVGIGFAIPADVAQRVTQQLMRGQAIERGYIGVQIGNLAPYREALGLGADVRGAYVVSITEGGPAARAGMQAGDIVTSINGQAIDGSVALTRAVGQVNPGEQIRLDVLRDGRRQSLTVRSGTRPSREELAAQDAADPDVAAPDKPDETGEMVEGLTVAPLTSALRDRYSIPAGVNGLVVTGVAPNSAAARLRLQAGFVILRADSRATASVADLRAAADTVRRAGRPGVLLLVRTPEGNAPVVLELTAPE